MSAVVQRSGGPCALHSLATAEDVMSLRSAFHARLVSDHAAAVATLEVRSGTETAGEILRDSIVESTTPDELLNPAPGAPGRTYEQIVWFNGLNWVRPRHAAALAALRRRLKEGGRLFISYAAHFFFVDDCPNTELTLANEIRAAEGLEPVSQDFGELRFGVEELRRLLFGLRIVRFEHIEADVVLATDAFREWHSGSVKCLFPDTGGHLPRLADHYMARLYDVYRGGKYRPRLCTTLVCAELPHT